MMWMSGLLALLLGVAYAKVVDTPRAAAQKADRTATSPAPAVMESSGKLSPRLSEYVFLHQTRDESSSIQAMTVTPACPE